MSKIKFYFVNKILRVSFALSNAFRKRFAEVEVDCLYIMAINNNNLL